jgi:serine/threonine-protein kinase RsbT
MTGRRSLRLAGEADIAAAARAAREAAEACGLTRVEAQHVATAVSEVAGNAVRYGGGGEVELAPAERAGRRGLAVRVRDAGAGIADLDAALRDGVSTGGSLGLGLPGARRLMDDFAIRSGPDGTEVEMARWEGGLLATHIPAACTVHEGAGGEAMAQPFRNGLLLGVAAAGPRAGDVVRAWRTRPWHAPPRLAEAGRDQLAPGERIGLAVASVSALDGRLAWLSAGAVACALLRAGGDLLLLPPRAAALGHAGGGPLRAATIDIRRDDVIVMAAAPIEAGALAQAAAEGFRADAPAALLARFERGALEPRRPPRRALEGLDRRSTLEGP